ncbi:MAG: hypothetical protein IT270_09135 [Saprospiraceae bacterium]|nr:hypothetical protein [Saprospiraceae bacterium]
MNNIKLHDAAFGAALILLLVPLFSTTYLVTGDGPCHLYNSRILLDWLSPELREIYKPFLQLNNNIDPNWLTNMIQIPLLGFLPAPMAEKAFFAIYLTIFAFGLRFLARQFGTSALMLVPLSMLFAWNQLVFKGFTNNSLSFALLPWVVGTWIKLWDGYRTPDLLRLAMLFLMLFFAHPIGLVFSLLAVACLSVWKTVYTYSSKGFREARLFLTDQLIKGVLVAHPAILLMGHFYLRQNWSKEKNVKAVNTDIIDLLSLKTIWLTPSDRFPAIVAGVIMLVLLGMGLITRLQSRKWAVTDGLLLFWLITVYWVFNPPAAISGGLEINTRLAFLPFMTLLFWLFTLPFSEKTTKVASFSALGILLVLTVLRLPVFVQASDLAGEVVSCSDAIDEGSTVLVLNYDWQGLRPDGNPIAKDIWLFLHVDGYLGAGKSLVLSDNYEANFWYFPLIERWETNMYKQTDKDGINFDHRPPRADFLDYNRRTGGDKGQNIDYVLMLSYRDEFAGHPYTKEIFDQLNVAYKQVFVSEHKRAILYQRLSK